MKEKSLEQLLAEREALADKLIRATGGNDEEFQAVCIETARYFLKSLQLVMNPTPELLSPFAIFALRTFAKQIADQSPGAEQSADAFASLVDIKTTTLKMPRIKRKENDEEGEE